MLARCRREGPRSRSSHCPSKPARRPWAAPHSHAPRDAAPCTWRTQRRSSETPHLARTSSIWRLPPRGRPSRQARERRNDPQRFELPQQAHELPAWPERGCFDSRDIPELRNVAPVEGLTALTTTIGKVPGRVRPAGTILSNREEGTSRLPGWVRPAPARYAAHAAPVNRNPPLTRPRRPEAAGALRPPPSRARWTPASRPKAVREPGSAPHASPAPPRDERAPVTARRRFSVPCTPASASP